MIALIAILSGGVLGLGAWLSAPGQLAAGKGSRPQTSSAASGPHVHRVGSSHLSLSVTQRRQLTEALAAAVSRLPGRTVKTAIASGYQIADHQHLIEPVAIRGDLASFDPANPPMLLVEGLQDDDRITAFVYWVETATDDIPAPAGFSGSADMWHHHRLACQVGDVVKVGDLDPTLSLRSCTAQGGVILTPGGWMLHVWAVPGVSAPDGDMFFHSMR